MNTIDDRLREAAQDVHDAFATAQRSAVPGIRRSPSPAKAVVAGVLVVFLIALPIVVLRGSTGGTSAGAPAQPETTATAATTSVTPGIVDDSTIPIVVLDYWALDGTLESVGSEEGWLCPARSNAGYTSVVNNADMPQELKVGIPGFEPVETLNRDDGPVCRQPHTLVMLSPTDDEASGSIADAGMTVWPQVTRFADACGDDTGDCVSFDGGPVDELIINDHPARLQLHSQTGSYDVWWVEESGTPMYAETSGLGREQVLELIGSITVDPVTRRATVDTDTLGDLEVVSDQASVGVWERGYWRYVTYSIDGTDVAINTSRNAAFDPYARFASLVEFLSVVEVQNLPAVWGPDHGGFLVFTSAEGVRVSIEGAPSVEEAIAIAARLTLSTDRS